MQMQTSCMMPSLLDTALSVLPYHLLCYGSLLGVQLYQSFINTKICFQALPMPQFTTLQKRLFPAYFKCQVGLAVLTAATHPPGSIMSLVKDLKGLVPLAIILAVDASNWFVFGPKTIKSMTERIHQETRDGRSYRDVDAASPEMKLLNRQFSRDHAMAIHLNAISMIATIWYGLALASRITLA